MQRDELEQNFVLCLSRFFGVELTAHHLEVKPAAGVFSSSTAFIHPRPGRRRYLSDWAPECPIPGRMSYDEMGSRSMRSVFRLWRLLAPALVLLLVAAPSAVAHERLDLNLALRIAQRTWGPAPCPAGVRFAWTDLSGNGFGADEWAAAYMPGAAPPGADCTIFFDSYNWRTVRAWWAGKCTFVVHEYGHLTGHQHSADSRNVMYGGDGAFRPYWRCMRAQAADRWG